MKYIEHNNKIISGIELANTEFKRTIGLMFRTNINNSLLFELKNPHFVCIHTLFVFFPIDVLFLDSNYKILKTTTLKPFIGFASSTNTKYIIEAKSGTIKRFNLKIGNQLHLKSF